jgi:hypothetical protein
VKSVKVARVRAILGVAFAVLGVLIALQLAVRVAPFNEKIFGFVFAAALVGLGVVRVRQYLAVRDRAP